MYVEWDPEKEKRNIHKHGVSFEEAREVFADPLHIAVLDERFSYFEERWIVIGRTIVAAVLWDFDAQEEEVVRIISAREATRHEREQYEEHE